MRDLNNKGDFTSICMPHSIVGKDLKNGVVTMSVSGHSQGNSTFVRCDNSNDFFDYLISEYVQGLSYGLMYLVTEVDQHGNSLEYGYEDGFDYYNVDSEMEERYNAVEVEVEKTITLG
ncbi:hypothetical protein [Weissella soli]|uniref:hypothetical protein n=1 Tax=Weissella soli TaxID=155866 RepID=UPI0035A12F0E